MKNDNYTYLNIRLTPDLVEKLIQGMTNGQLENQSLTNIEFPSTQSDSEALLKAIDLAINKSEKLSKVRIKIKSLLNLGRLFTLKIIFRNLFSSFYDFSVEGNRESKSLLMINYYSV